MMPQRTTPTKLDRRKTGPDSQADEVRAAVVAECDRKIALGSKGPPITIEGIAKDTGWSRAVIYKHKLQRLIKDKIKEQRRLRTDRRRSRDEVIARLQDELARAQQENDGLRAKILLMEEAAYAAGVKPDSLYEPVHQPTRATTGRTKGAGPQLA